MGNTNIGLLKKKLASLKNMPHEVIIPKNAFTGVFDQVIKQVCCQEHQGTDNLVYCCGIHFLETES